MFRLKLLTKLYNSKGLGLNYIPNCTMAQVQVKTTYQTVHQQRFRLKIHTYQTVLWQRFKLKLHSKLYGSKCIGYNYVPNSTVAKFRLKIHTKIYGNNGLVYNSIQNCTVAKVSFKTPYQTVRLQRFSLILHIKLYGSKYLF